MTEAKYRRQDDGGGSQDAVPRLTIPRRILTSLLRLFFKLLYHQLAWTYDGVAWIVSSGAWQKWVTTVLPYLDGPLVLEIGYGPGHLQVQLQTKGVWVVGIDESSTMAGIARRRILKKGLSPQLLRGNALSLPFKNECFHQVAMTFPAEFLFNLSTYAEIQRVLIHGGKAVVLPLAWITGRKPWERLAAWFNRFAGEAPDWDDKVLKPLEKLGFDSSWTYIDLHSSRLLVVQLSKP